MDEYCADGPLPTVPSLLAENEHGVYCVPFESAERPAARRVLGGAVWEPDTVAALAESAAAGDVVSAGTYFGDLLPGVAAAAGSTTTIWAFEPNRTSFVCASWTLRLNRLANVRLFNAALGETASTMELVVGDDRGAALGGVSHLARDEASGRRRVRRRRPRTEPCAVVAIDAVVDPERRVSMVQLDVEGFEAHALAGAAGVLERWRPQLLLETPVEGTPVWDVLASLGYRRDGQVERNHRYVVT